MKVVKKLCDGCGKIRPIWKNINGEQFCKYCALAVSTKKPKQGVRAPRSSSRKKSKQDTEYTKLRREFLLSSPMCQARIPGHCTLKATDIHHTAGRGLHYLETNSWLPTCRGCHQWIHDHPTEAKQLGFSQNRLNSES